MVIKNILIAIFLTLYTYTGVMAETVALKPDHPDRYTVVKGDTLWDISAKFLQDPWLWPEIWQINPDISNPHLIYPGDEIYLSFVDGKPVIRVQRNGLKKVKLSPQAHATPIDTAIPTIPLDAIKQFLSYPRVMSQEEMEAAPYILANQDGRLISGSNNKVYARGIEESNNHQYRIFRPGSPYRSPGAKRKDILGYEALHVGDAAVLNFGDPTTLRITESNQEILIRDRLFPALEEETIIRNFIPRTPEKELNGHIVAVLSGVSRIGQFSTVVIDIGKDQNIESGHVLAIYQTGEVVRDTINPKNGKTVKLPDERAGTLMVIRPFERVSYALVMKATRAMKVFDSVKTP